MGFLDESGLSHLWVKIEDAVKTYISKKIPIVSGNKSGTSVSFGRGSALGEYSVASGLSSETDDEMNIVQDLVWPTNSTAPVKLPPAKAIGNMSVASGPGSVSLTTGSKAVGVNTTAGAKGFYWYDYRQLVTDENANENEYLVGINITSVEENEQCRFSLNSDDFINGLIIQFADGESRNVYILGWDSNENVSCIDSYDNIRNGSGEYFVFYPDPKKYVPNREYLIRVTTDESWDGTLETDEAVTVCKKIPDTAVLIRLSEYQPVVSYNPNTPDLPDHYNSMNEDGTYNLNPVWSPDAQKQLRYWSPIVTVVNGEKTHELITDVNYAVISFYGGHKHSLCSKVLAVQGNNERGYILVDSLPDPWESSDGVRVSAIQWDEFLVYCPERPEYGVVEASLNGLAIGQDTIASGHSSLAQGFGSNAAGSYATALGINTKAGYAAVSAGSGSKATGLFSTSVGLNSEATADQSLAAGHLAKAYGESSAALNSRTKAEGAYSTAFGRYTTAAGAAQIVQGRRNIVDTDLDKDGYGKYLHIIGNSKGETPSNAYTLDWDGNARFAGNVYVGDANAGTRLITTDEIPTIRPGTGTASVLEGDALDTKTKTDDSGDSVKYTSGNYSHAQNRLTFAPGKYSHSEGNSCESFGDQSHSEGHKSIASGKTSHAQNRQTKATGDYTHSEGGFTEAAGQYQHVQGTYNIVDTTKRTTGPYMNRGEYAHIVGNGTSDTDRSNAHTLDWEGNAWFAGDVTIGNDKTRLATEKYVEDATSGLSVSEIYIGSSEPKDEDITVWIDPDASEDDIYEYVTKELAKRGQLKPEFANDISECTDTAKLYVLPDGYIYAYMSSLVYPYTNQITESISSDGTQFVGDNSEDGYIANRAMSLSTGGLYEAQGVGVTGFIPVTKGDVLNFKNYSFTPGTAVTGTGFVLYGSDFSRIDGINGASIIDTMAYLISPYSVDSDGYLASMTICDKYSSGIAYVRFSGAGLDDSTIITKNEEILDPAKEYRWANTRLAFVPADYEDRIIAAEESIADHEERVKVLELYGADSTSGEDIPAYIKAEADGVIDRLIENQGDHSFTFIGMSDFHYQNYAEKYPGAIEDSVDNLKRASKAAAYIMGRIHVDAVATLGDNGAFGEGTESQLAYAHRWHRQINEILGMTQQPGVVDFRTPGNHDRMGANDTAIMPDSAIYRYITGYNRQNTCFNVPGGWCYHDFTGHKLRVIMLNTAECEGKSRFNIHSGYHISNEQYNWLINALDMSGKEDAGEWQILILSHHRADDYQVTSDGSTTEYILPNILNAYKTGGSYSAEIASDGISVSCDFSEKNQARLIGQIHGHHHNYKYGHLNLGAQGNTETDIIAVGTPTTSFVTDGNDDNDGNVYTSVKDTATETAFCVYSIDLDTHKIYAIHYGNGVDREINY